MEDKELQEFDLDSIMSEFMDEPAKPAAMSKRNTGPMPNLTARPKEVPIQADTQETKDDLDGLLAEPEAGDADLLGDLEALLAEPEEDAAAAAAASQEPEPVQEESAEQEENIDLSEDTLRFDLVT